MTTQGATFNMHGQLYRKHTSVTALLSSPVVSALGSESNNLRVEQPPSRTSESNNKIVLVEARCCVLETCRKKNASSAFKLG